ncbi:hypothetical protein Cgig2_031361 [Carnegiea gigantea]|uniref:FAR1 domain-containing protein n=1 Tax=Carnegiea gigantea TaxID=171969 RepID=A0A9Q1JQI4_9CARY|nr:hypothetical protein Cgig2_031361 [Carnegiea gigantea]
MGIFKPSVTILLSDVGQSTPQMTDEIKDQLFSFVLGHTEAAVNGSDGNERGRWKLVALYSLYSDFSSSTLCDLWLSPLLADELEKSKPVIVTGDLNLLTKRLIYITQLRGIEGVDLIGIVDETQCVQDIMHDIVSEEKQNEGTSSNFIDKRLDNLDENDMKKLIFKTPVECEVFYFSYAKAIGFGVGREALRINRHGIVTSLRFCCDREGVRSEKDKNCEDKKRKARDETRCFCKAFIKHKYEIVTKLQERKHICGMTGDGVSDAPALKKADIGIAVADATDIYAVSITIHMVFGFIFIALIWKFDFASFMLLIIAILNDGTIKIISKDMGKPSLQPDGWKLKEIFATGIVLGVSAKVLKPTIIPPIVKPAVDSPAIVLVRACGYSARVHTSPSPEHQD